MLILLKRICFMAGVFVLMLACGGCAVHHGTPHRGSGGSAPVYINYARPAGWHGGHRPSAVRPPDRHPGKHQSSRPVPGGALRPGGGR